MRTPLIDDVSSIVGHLRFPHLAVLMTAELFLFGIALPAATKLTGDVLLFPLLTPLQFFNRYGGLKLSGERPRLIMLYRDIFTIILLLWLLWELVSFGLGADPGIHVMVYAALTAVSGIVLVPIVYNIWTIPSINSDVLFGIIICYATVIVVGFELHAINHRLQPGAYSFLLEMKHHSQLLFQSLGTTTTLGGPIGVNTTPAQLINTFQAYLIQLVLKVLVFPMTGLHTGSNEA